MNKRQRKKVNKKKQISKTVNIIFYENENKILSNYLDSCMKVVDDQTLNEKED